jgi:alkylation response protein AidB-like acyl-CoA dehydrogenase
MTDDAAGWVDRARGVAAELGATRPDRDQTGGAPHDEVALLKRAGLVTLLGPTRHGGGGQEWPTAHRVVRQIAAADAMIGRMLGYHYVLSWLAPFIATDEKIQHIGEVAARAQWLFGGAARVRQGPLTITDAGDMMIFNGTMSPAVGSEVSDITMLEGFRPGHDIPISALAVSTEDGLTCAGRTEAWSAASGTLVARNVAIPWTGALGHVDKTFQPRPYNEFIAPTLHIVLANVHLGIARSALEAATSWLPTRPGPGAGIDELAADLWAAETFADSTADQAAGWHREPGRVTEHDRTDHETRVAAMLATATGIIAKVGAALAPASAPEASPVLDRFFRDVRTLAVQSPPYLHQQGSRT